VIQEKCSIERWLNCMNFGKTNKERQGRINPEKKETSRFYKRFI